MWLASISDFWESLSSRIVIVDCLANAEDQVRIVSTDDYFVDCLELIILIKTTLHSLIVLL